MIGVRPLEVRGKQRQEREQRGNPGRIGSAAFGEAQILPSGQRRHPGNEERKQPSPLCREENENQNERNEYESCKDAFHRQSREYTAGAGQIPESEGLERAACLGRDALTHRNLHLFGIFFHFAAGFADAAIAALAALKIGDGLEQVNAAEVGPEALGDKDFGVGNLPQQKI